MKSCGFNWRPHNTTGDSWHANVQSAVPLVWSLRIVIQSQTGAVLHSQTSPIDSPYTHPSEKIKVPHPLVDPSLILDPIHKMANAFTETITHCRVTITGTQVSIRNGLIRISSHIQPPNSIEQQAIIGAHYFVFPAPSPEQYYATNDFLEAIGYLPGTTIPPNALFHNKFTLKCAEKTCTYSLYKLYP